MDKSQLPPLATPQTAHIRASYPIIEYLEDGYVADWLKERRDQLLELAREERSGINANKLVSSAVLAAGFFFHALSPLAPVGAVLGIVGYVHGCFIDANQTGSFSLLPFVRGNVLDLAGTLGNAELRGVSNGDVEEFETLQYYLPSSERKEFQLIETHFAVLSEYLTQVEPLKRFHAYRWIFDCFIKYQALPSSEQIQSHMRNVAIDLRTDHSRLEALEQRRAFLDVKNKPKQTIDQMHEFPLMPEVQVKLIPPEVFKISPKIPLAEKNETSVFSGITQDQEINESVDMDSPTGAKHPENLYRVNMDSPTGAKRPENPCQPDLQALLSLPLAERAIALIDLLDKSGFDLGRCIRKQVNVIAGTQRAGKGTLMGILSILSAALKPGLKIHYFTAGDDIYPFQCDRLCCASSYPYMDEPDAKVASELLRYLEEMERAKVGEYSDRVLVIDEAVALSDYIDGEKMQWMVKFLLTRAAKKGARIFIVLHGQNLTSWTGTGKTGGFASTFKTSVSFIGCESASIKLSPLETIDVATGRYFLADPDEFAKALPDGEIGTLPDWLKSEINPLTGQPDPVRSLLKVFPELHSQDVAIKSNSTQQTASSPQQPKIDAEVAGQGEEEEVRETEHQVKETKGTGETINSESQIEISQEVVVELASIAKKHMKENREKWTTFNLSDFRQISKFRNNSSLNRNLRKEEVEKVINVLMMMEVVELTGEEGVYSFIE